ncbi:MULTISPECIES: dihydrolipoamide acetyltransferase family protein [Staphylococcus]|uniref:dihydrolipoamide acetyltransferase family protein n=1 Tax=Staphylococcus TaxID=1279 RepID=UPI00066D002B|nr:dihydrolipoamide acetyltransferase family protein [Staphylococcus hominis]MCI2840837.1 2-oxo acid dehydrogenase subunit E2 [Staphylococcus hominis]MCI2879847.1 2-oxo acid dehydrogenase subunit E2 [Staphylococcus hominis]MDS3833468.1 dihydrolipoamide acetyltransferase family protein [Staphylococcus hominis]
MDVKMPKLGESVHEGTIEQWLVSEGNHVDEYEPLCEVVTDKVTAEVPSTISGTITELIATEGETIEINQTICKIQPDDTSLNSNQDDTDETNETPSQTQSNSVKSQSKPSNTNQSSKHSINNGRFSPVVFKIASENDIDLSQVPGTGFEGRVTKKDIETYIQENNQQNSKETYTTQITNHSETTSRNNNASLNEPLDDYTISVKGVRKAIAQNMVTSATEIPHGWMMIEVDATNLVKTRNHYKTVFKKQEGYNLTFFAFFVKAVAEALKSNPLLNSSWDGNEIIIHKDINISIAVADEDKLYVPVIKNADEKSIKGIAREINQLAQKARNQQLAQEDMTGGTFTVNNTGTFGSVSSMGIINHPQAAILQVESIVKKPVVIDDMIAIRNMVNLCISIDHRILDGVQTGRFMSQVKNRIESYSIETTNIY